MQLNHVIHINIKKNGTDGHFMPPDTTYWEHNILSAVLSKLQSLNLSWLNTGQTHTKPCSTKLLPFTQSWKIKTKELSQIKGD